MKCCTRTIVQHKGAVNRFVGHESYVMSVKFDPKPNNDTHILISGTIIFYVSDAIVLFLGSFDETVRVWDLRQNAQPLTEIRAQTEIRAHADPISAVHFNYNGQIFATASYDGLWSAFASHNFHLLAVYQSGLAIFRKYLEMSKDDSRKRQGTTTNVTLILVNLVLLSTETILT